MQLPSLVRHPPSGRPSPGGTFRLLIFFLLLILTDALPLPPFFGASPSTLRTLYRRQGGPGGLLPPDYVPTLHYLYQRHGPVPGGLLPSAYDAHEAVLNARLDALKDTNAAVRARELHRLMKRQGGGAPDTSGAQGSSKRAYSPTLDYTLRFDKDYVPTLIDTLEFTNDYSPSVSDIEQPTDIYQPSVIDIFQPTDIYQPTNEYIYEDTKIYQPTIDYIYEDVKIHQPSDMYIYEDAKIHQPSDIYAVEFVETYAPTYEITTEYVLEYAPTVGGPPPDGDPHKPGARTVDPHGHYLDPEHDDPKGNPADPKGKGKGGKAGKGGKGGKGGPPGKKERDTPVNQNENNNKNSFDIDVDAGDKSPEEKPKPKPAEKKHKPYNGLPTRHYAAAINRLQEDTPHIGHPGLLEVRAQKLAPDSTKDFSQHEVVTLMAFPAPPEGKKKRWCKVKFGTPEEGGGVVDVWQMDADPADVLGATWGKNLKRDKKIGTWSTEKHAWLSGDGEVREGVVIEISWADKQEGGVMWGEEEVRLFLDDD